MYKCAQIEERNFQARIRMATGNDKIADFTINIYAALMLKHSQRGICAVSDLSKKDCFQRSCFICTLKNVTAKTYAQTELIFLIAMTNLVNVTQEGKVPDELREERKPSRRC